MKKSILHLLLLSTFNCFGQIDLPVDFELSSTNYFTDFGGMMSETTADPTDPSNTVAVSSKSPTAETWAGTTLGDNGLSAPIPFTSSSTTMSLRVFSEYPGTPILLKAEDLVDPGIFVETRMYTTKANEWETIVFDFSDPVFGSPPLNLNIDYRKLSVFFNFGSLGQQDYYWDDVMMGGISTTLAQIDLPVTFEAPGVSYALVDFENNISSIGPDPVNASQTVAITTKPVNTSAWSGTIIGTRNGFANTIPFSPANTKISMRVYSPDINTPVLLKAEVASNPTQYVETLQYTTTENEWEIMEWNFLQHVPNTPPINFNLDYNLLAVFFNFGVEGAAVGERTYDWDDVTFLNSTNTEQVNAIPLAVFPNPVKNELYINTDAAIKEMSIVNTMGQTVMSEKPIGFHTNLDLSFLAPGTYFLTVRTSEGRGSQLLVKK